MKKTITALAIFGCMWGMSCSHPDDGFTPDTSLAGSITVYGYYVATAEGTYNDTSLSGLQAQTSMLNIRKISDTEVSLDFRSKWDQGKFGFGMPLIPVLGVPYDAYFDCTSTEAVVSHDEIGNRDITATVTGRMRQTGYTRTSLAYPDYDCEIHIDCSWNDAEGKSQTLCFKITDIAR